MNGHGFIDDWYLNNVICPRDHLELSQKNNLLVCPQGHNYPIVDGIPIMLLDDVKQTIGVAEASLRRARGKEIDNRAPGFYLESLAISEEEKSGVIALSLRDTNAIDPVVSYIIGATSGIMYKHLIGKLNSYPIPDILLPSGKDKTLLDVGCGWGRWCIAAAQKGYDVVGIDPSLGAIMAARRVSQQKDLRIKYLVADARYMPFNNNKFENVFSYSVLQHLNEGDVKIIVSEIARVLVPLGTSFIQMANIFGIRSLFVQAKRLFRKKKDFEVHYWSIPSLKRLFTERIGGTQIFVDCFFGLGLQYSDAKFMTPMKKRILSYSNFMKRLSNIVPFLAYLADGLYVKSTHNIKLN